MKNHEEPRIHNNVEMSIKIERKNPIETMAIARSLKILPQQNLRVVFVAISPLSKSSEAEFGRRSDCDTPREYDEDSVMLE